jgi:hypothetical protein
MITDENQVSLLKGPQSLPDKMSIVYLYHFIANHEENFAHLYPRAELAPWSQECSYTGRQIDSLNYLWDSLG